MLFSGPGGILHTDLYQLTMVQAYLEEGLTAPAAFEFFVRKLPARRGFLVAAGLEQAVAYLRSLQATEAEIAWLRGLDRFSDRLLDWLQALRFEGDVDAMPEGTVVFADEPLLRVVAPLPVAQLVETRLINLLHFQTLIASKAARIRLAAGDKTLIDFGYRRAHGAEAGVLAARAAVIGGFDGTATVIAGKSFGIPLSGTMAHSFIQAHATEAAAFRAFARSCQGPLTLLIDTYDTERGAERVAALAPELAAAGTPVRAVRLDSGDLADHARKVRRILDGHGLREVSIVASGGLDEDAIARMVEDRVPIDGFGVGTSLTTSQDVPAFDCAYKLQEYDGLARRKTSEGKATWPGRKQVYRLLDRHDHLEGDILALADETPPPGIPLLRPVLRQGRQTGPEETLEVIAARTRAQLDCLPEPLRHLRSTPAPLVVPSAGLFDLAEEVDARLDREDGAPVLLPGHPGGAE